jgi:hypothetical protein
MKSETVGIVVAIAVALIAFVFVINPNGLSYAISRWGGQAGQSYGGVTTLAGGGYRKAT